MEPPRGVPSVGWAARRAPASRIADAGFIEYRRRRVDEIRSGRIDVAESHGDLDAGAKLCMLAKRIIPCLDVDHGRVVKGTNFLNLKDAGDPVEVAARYDEEGADELVFLDITASHEDRGILLDVVRRTAEVCFMPLTVGGGSRTLEEIRTLLSAGADKVSINSAAVRDPDLVRRAARRFGSQCIVVNIDPKRVERDGRETWEVHINGGRVPTGKE